MEEDNIINEVVQGSMKVNGNLEVGQQISSKELKVLDSETLMPIMTTGKDSISFKKICRFYNPVEFNNGKTIIGIETTYGSAYVGSPTIQAGSRLVVGDSFFKVDANDRTIVSDTFKMTLARLDTDNLIAKNEVADLIETKKLKVTSELIGKTIYADLIRTNNLVLNNVTSTNSSVTGNVTTKDLIVKGQAKIASGLTIDGTGTVGQALIVNGGQFVANGGIVSHTRNNKFQCMQIVGSGTDHDICFRIDRGVDSFIEGDVTISNSNLILDGSKLVTDNVIVTPINDVKSGNVLSGVQMTTASNWNSYHNGMVVEIDSETSNACNAIYDPVAVVQDAIERNQNNYVSVSKTIKSLVNPITYAMERFDVNIPKKFTVKNGVYRVDSSGNALFRNIVSERGRFSKLDAYELNVNKVKIDKVVTTSVASNVVETDNLLKSTGITELDGSVHTKADIFVEEGSSINVADGVEMTFRQGSSLKLANGASFEMGSNTSFNVKGDMEIDVSRLVFKDDAGNKYRIAFRPATTCEGEGVVMEYFKVEDEQTETPREIVDNTERSAV